MKTYKNLFLIIVCIKNLYLGFLKARKGKRKKLVVLRFEQNLEKNLFKLNKELLEESYFLGDYRKFIIFEPKKRIISALPFRDRVVQHAVCNLIGEIFEKSFIYDSYACRKGKGTHKALDRLRSFLRKEDFYVFKGDIKKYFFSVNHLILKRIIKRKIQDEKLLRLLDRIIDSGEGIPIGNLTSQLFANIYLNELDYFVKHRLKAKYYIRYMDDFIILDKDKKILQDYRKAIEEFLKTLKLELHPKKVRIFPARLGIDFLGYVVFKDYTLVRKRTLKKAKKNIKKKIQQYNSEKIDFDKLMQSFNSWNAYLDKADSYRLKRRLKEEFKSLM